MKVTAIVPALNEGERIGKVLEALEKSPEIASIMAINDGSVDKTESIIRKHKATLISNPRNLGQAESVRKALKHVDSEVVLLCDADLIGLKPKHIRDLVAPVIKDKRVMTVASLDKYWHLGSDFMKDKFMLIPITGTRALRTEHLMGAAASPLFSKYGIHPVINHYCRNNGVRMRRIPLKGVRDVIKTRKRNYGLIPHLQETVDIILVYGKLYFSDARSFVKERVIRNSND